MKIIFIFLWIALSTKVAGARAIDWPSGLALVQQNNPEWNAAQKTLQASQAQEAAARSGFLPDLSASLSSAQSYTESVSSQTQRSESVGLTLSQNVFAGFADINKYREAKQNTLIAEAQWKQTKAKIGYDYRSAYAGLQYAQEYELLTQKILARRKENLNIVQLRFNSGRENKGSVLLSEAYYQQAVYDSIQAGLQLDVAQNTLAQVLGISLADDGLAISKDIPLNEIEDVKAIDFRKIAVLTPDYQKAVAQSEAAQFVNEQAKANYYPSLNLTGTLGKTDATFPPENDRWSVGVNLSIPIFSGGRDYANQQAAKYRSLAAEINRTTISYQVLVRLKQAYSQFRLAIEKVKVDEKFKLAAQMRSEIAKKKYNNGLMSFEDWDVVENDLIQREKSILSSFRDRVVGQANWEQTQGIGLWP